MQTIQQAWSELEAYQKFVLVTFAIFLPLGTVYPMVMEILLLPLSFVVCVGG